MVAGSIYWISREGRQALHRLSIYWISREGRPFTDSAYTGFQEKAGPSQTQHILDFKRRQALHRLRIRDGLLAAAEEVCQAENTELGTDLLAPKLQAAVSWQSLHHTLYSCCLLTNLNSRCLKVQTHNCIVLYCIVLYCVV